MKYATRINTFRSAGSGSVEDALREIATVEGITHVDLNFPEHMAEHTPEQMKDLLRELGLTINSVAMRFRKTFVGGEYTNADPEVRREAIELTKQGIDLAAALGSDLVTVWLGFDGYDYTFQKDYAHSLALAVAAFQELADYRPDMRLTIEYKPYEERTFALIPNGGVTLHVLHLIDRPNVGATLDFCHQLMAGEMPAFPASLLLAQDKLWGIHLNDGNGRFDDGLMIGSVHPFETAELLYYLVRHQYDGVIYFDTFPIREAARSEAAINVATTNLLVQKVLSYGVDNITEVLRTSDGVKTQSLRNALFTPE